MFRLFLVFIFSICSIFRSDGYISFQSHLFDIRNDFGPNSSIRQNRLCGTKLPLRESVDILGDICEYSVRSGKDIKTKYSDIEKMETLISLMIFHFCLDTIDCKHGGGRRGDITTFDATEKDIHATVKNHSFVNDLDRINNILKDGKNKYVKSLEIDDGIKKDLEGLSVIDYAIRQAAYYIYFFRVYEYLYKSFYSNEYAGNEKPIIFVLGDLHYPRAGAGEANHDLRLEAMKNKIIKESESYQGNKIVVINGDFFNYSNVVREKDKLMKSFVDLFIEPLTRNNFSIVFNLGNHEIFGTASMKQGMKQEGYFFTDFMNYIDTLDNVRDRVVLVNSGRVFNPKVENMLWLKKFRSIYIDSFAILGEFPAYPSYPSGVFINPNNYMDRVIGEMGKFSDNIPMVMLMHMSEGDSYRAKQELLKRKRLDDLLVLGHIHSSANSVWNNFGKVSLNMVQPFYDNYYFMYYYDKRGGNYRVKKLD